MLRPPKELKGFRKVALAPGESATVTFSVGPEDLAFYHPGRKAWVAEAGVFHVYFGSSSHDIRVAAAFRLQAPYVRPVGGRARRPSSMPRLSGDTKLGEVLRDRQGRRVLQKHAGSLREQRLLFYLTGYSVNQVARYAPGRISPQQALTIAQDLEAIE